MKKNKNLILIIASIAILVGIVSFAATIDKKGEKNNISESSSGVLSAKENSYNFGKISIANGNISYRFKIENSGSESVIINKVYTSCMCTTASIINESGKNLGVFGMPGHGDLAKANIEVKSSESMIVEAVFDPAAHGPEGTGKIKRLIYLETNSQTNPKLQLAIEAEVTR